MTNAQVDDLSAYNTKYTSLALTQKVFAKIRRIGKGFSGVDTPFFDCMLVPQQVQNVEDAAEDEDANNEGKIAELDADKDVTLEEVDVEVAMDADVQGRLAKFQAKVYHLDLEHAEKVLSMQDTDAAELAKVEEVIEVVTAAKLMIEVVTTAATTITPSQVPKANTLERRMGVIIQDPEETATASVIMHSEAKSKDKGKGMTCNEIRPIFEKHYSLNQAFLERVEEEVIGQKEEGNKRKGENINQDAATKQRIDEEVEELKTHLQIVANDDDDVYTKATPLALKVPVDDYQIHHEHNKPYYKIIRADGTH
uniref:Uncharacterized protein n=1 Tax=Tanacetum cinerariifolium TaxID=118510 RepID=A0A6L2NTI5_TANCI|nr:hypothetical protein [Tanacetum cinerariifolium]